MKNTTSTLPCRFGFLPEGDQHHFCVIISKNVNDDVVIEERFLVPDPEKPLTKDRRAHVVSKLTRGQWEHISSHFVRTIKERLPKQSTKIQSFMVGENWIPRLLGKELCVLLWAIENASEVETMSALERWSHLTSEERWWLFNMGSADYSEHSHGWKLAIQVALCNRFANTMDSDTAQTSGHFGTISEKLRYQQ